MGKLRYLAGFPLRNTTTDEFTRFLHRRLRRRQPTAVLFANENLIASCGHLRQRITDASDIYVLNDGVAVDIAALLRFGSPFRENMNGTDFTPKFLSSLQSETRVFLFGSAANVVERTAAVFARLPGAEIAGTADGFSYRSNPEELLETIRVAEPDILLVALGNPMQEDWILRNRDKLNVPLVFAVGALFDFVSGAKPRAPITLRRLRMEWAYRLALEPKRLIGRYTIGVARFFAMALFSTSNRTPSGTRSASARA